MNECRTSRRYRHRSVDTPGLDSLAKRGAAETLAYLPSCDLAVLLIDAGATLNEEDVGTVRLLYEAGIPVLVLLSKSDLLADGDLHRTISYIEARLKHELGIAATVHAVSALSKYQVLLDQFFERELLPRFEKARFLREASITRKIGAMRDAIMAALDSNLQRGKRGVLPAPAIASGVESVLRVITGEVGEQHTALDHAFRTLGETPDAVIEKVTDKATWLMYSTRCHLCRSLNGFTRPLMNLSNRQWRLCVRLVKALSSSCNKLQSRWNAAMLRRRMTLKRFCGRCHALKWRRCQSLSMQGPGDSGDYKILRSRIKAGLRQNIGLPLKNDMHLYGMALSQWSDQIVRKLELLINSYADAYRMQIHRFRGTSDPAVNPGQLQADLELLKNWRPANSATLTDTHA